MQLTSYNEELVKVTTGISAIPNPTGLSSMPLAPTASDLTDNQIIAPDRLAMVDMKLKGTLLRLITSTGWRQYFMEAVGPSGITSGTELLIKLNADAKQSESEYSQSHHSVPSDY